MDVQARYAALLAARQATLDVLARRDRATANARLAAFALALLSLWLGLGLGLVSPWWAAVPASAFLALVVVHDRLLRRLDEARLAVDHYEHGLARVRDTWAGRGPAGRQFVDASHPYSGDLDVFGHGSLYQLLCQARTRAGEECLADWLRVRSGLDVVRARQVAVAELQCRTDLREEMAVLGGQGSSQADPAALAEWGGAAGEPPSAALRAGLAALGALAVAALVWWAAGRGLAPLGVMVLVQGAVAAATRRRIRAILAAVEGPAHDLGLVAALLSRLEREACAAPLLVALRDGMSADGPPASTRIGRLQRLVDYSQMDRNVLFAPIAALLLWRQHYALAIEAWQAANGPRVEGWLRGLGEFEALCSLSGYAFEHPDDVQPDLADGPACFAAEGLAHPLLPRDQAIRNDVALGDAARLLIVSGSNMSGKSTLLRAVGVNAVLAFAGAPVRATRLRLSGIDVAASMRAVDSLQQGVSHFYAEITRLRQVVAIADDQPALFLLDEVLHGTNSHDRLIGAAAIVRALVKHGAIGLVTTHDLALAQLADDPSLHAVNVHFEDHLDGGRMAFDYRLHPGVVARSNAIELMRAVGLPV